MSDEVSQLKNKIRKLEFEVERLRNKNEELSSELDKHKEPPLYAGRLIELLDGNRAIVENSNGLRFVANISDSVDEDKLEAGSLIGMEQRSMTVMEVLPDEKEPDVKGMEMIDRPDTRYTDVGGLVEEIKKLRETVELPLTSPQKMEKVGVTPPNGVLLYGPPGNGKTLLARAVAGETNASFIRIVGSELVKKYIGEGAKLVRQVFNLAREESPSIIFIDEIDAISSKRMNQTTGGDREVNRTMMQLLSELDGFDPRGDVRIIGATNRIDILDEAILRPGRFDRKIEIPKPIYEGRKEILKIHSRDMNLRNVDLDEIAELTEGSTGADLRSICTEAGMNAVREDREFIVHEDFLDSMKEVLQEVERTEPEKGVMYG